MATLQAAVTAIQALVMSLSGIRRAPDYAPEQISGYPFAVCYPSSGQWEFGPAADKKGLHTITLELHFSRADTPRGIAAAMLYSDSIPNVLLKNPTLQGTVDTIVPPIEYTFGGLSYGGVETLGWTWQVTVKMESPIT